MDDRRFRAIVRSALALSFGTPAVILGACSRAGRAPNEWLAAPVVVRPAPRSLEAMRVIAEDETRHAALAWAVAARAMPKLGAASRARVEAAREAAHAEPDRIAPRAAPPAFG